MAGSRVIRTITSPFRKACTLFNTSKEEKKHEKGNDPHCLSLHGQVMACAYEDVQVMWSILDKSKPRATESGG